MLDSKTKEGEFWRILLPGIYTMEVFAEGVINPEKSNLPLSNKILLYLISHYSLKTFKE